MFNDAFGALADQRVDLFPKDIEQGHAQRSAFPYDRVTTASTKPALPRASPLTLFRAYLLVYFLPLQYQIYPKTSKKGGD